MAANFDPYDKHSWYFGPLTRQEATDILLSEMETGVFLVRNSSTIQGDLVLCVREDNKVSHYIINRIQQEEQTRFRIGDQMFPDVPSLLNFYKLHYLDTTPLMKPAQKKLEKVRAKYDFEGSGDPDDLPFKKGEILTVISKDEEQWWTAKNSLGQTGSIPVPYIEKVVFKTHANNIPAMVYLKGMRIISPLLLIEYPQSLISATYRLNKIIKQKWYHRALPAPITVDDNFLPDGAPNSQQPTPRIDPINYNKPIVQRKLPALARVKQARVPNAYDKSALKLEVGDVIKVTKMNINGQWEGELRGKTGHFPFTHVEFVDSENVEEEEA